MSEKHQKDLLSDASARMQDTYQDFNPQPICIDHLVGEQEQLQKCDNSRISMQIRSLEEDLSFKAKLLKNHLTAVEVDFSRGQGKRGSDLEEKARFACSKS